MRPRIPAANILRLGDFRQILSAGSIRRFNTQILTDVARVTPLWWISLASTAGMAVRHVIDVTFRRSTSPDRLLVWSTLPPAAVLGRLIGRLPGTRTTWWVAGLATALSLLWIHHSPPRTARDIPEDHVLGGSPSGIVRQEAAGAGKNASVPGTHPAGGDRTDST